MQEPVVTVSIPTRNRAELLSSCLESVLSQSFDAIEVYVSDNASTDHTADVVAAIDDPRVHYAPLQENIGLFGNLTRALHLGQAPYVVVQSDDDFMLPGSIERRVAFLERHPSAGFVHSAFYYINPHGRLRTDEVASWANLEADTVESGAQFIWRCMRQGNLVCLPTVMYRRTALDGMAFEEKDGPCCDNGLWLRIALGHDVGYIHEPLVGWRTHQGSQTAAYELADMKRGRYQLTREHVQATRQPFERFLRTAPLDPATRQELWRTWRRYRLRLRLGIAAQDVVPAPLVRAGKSYFAWLDRWAAGRRQRAG